MLAASLLLGPRVVTRTAIPLVVALAALAGGVRVRGAETPVILRAIPVDPATAAAAAEADSVADAAERAAAVVPRQPDAPPTPAFAKLAALDRDDAVRLQIFLDEACFGPGVIDGKPGLFTRQAIASWNEVNGHPVGEFEAVLAAARAAVPDPYGLSFVPAAAAEWVDPTLPTERAEQALRKRMSYRSLAEFMAERYHTAAGFLTELNGQDKLGRLKVRDPVIVPNVRAFRIEAVAGTRHEAEEALAGLGARHMVVDTRTNQLRIFEAAPPALVVEGEAGAPRPNRALVASFPITPGQDRFVKLGHFELRNCLELPHWRYDQQLLDSGQRSDDALTIPPGPNSPVGVLWAGLSRPGIGLHGTSDPETIGRTRSAGCIRLANWDAIRLPVLVRPGATVEIR